MSLRTDKSGLGPLGDYRCFRGIADYEPLVHPTFSVEKETVVTEAECPRAKP